MPTFAIVVPNLNQSHFLPWALESLTIQDHPFHLALMDGGSTDGFEEAIEGYSNIISYLHSGPDGGQAAAIQKGIEAIPGDIIGWLNADDYYFPDTLERVASCFEKDPGLDIIYGDAIHVTADGCFLSYFPAIQAFDAKDLTRSCFICQPACFVRRSAYERAGGLNPALRYTMDWDLWCRLSQVGARFQYVPEVLAAVRYYPGTKTRSRDRRRYREIWRIERVYGRRRLPRSWVGFYHFDLICQENKTGYERLFLQILGPTRTLKRRLGMKGLKLRQQEWIHGFKPWETVVNGQGIIRMPWYDRRDWMRLYLEVAPVDAAYRVTVDDALERRVLARNGLLSIDLPPLHGFLRKIAVSCPGRAYWDLFAVRFDVTDEKALP